LDRTCPTRHAPAHFQLPLQELLNEFVKRREFFHFHHLELVDKVDEMLEAGVEMGFSRKQHDVLKVGVVDVRVNSEQSLKDHLYYVDKVSGERNAQLTRENLFVV
jgi:hypothetical protein